MNNNYAWQKHLENQRLRSRLTSEEAQRLAQLGNTGFKDSEIGTQTRGRFSRGSKIAVLIAVALAFLLTLLIVTGVFAASPADSFYPPEAFASVTVKVENRHEGASPLADQVAAVSVAGEFAARRAAPAPIPGGDNKPGGPGCEAC